MHLMKLEEWEICGEWHCADTSDIVHGSASWWLPCRALGISPAQFVELLAKKYNCDNIQWFPENNVLLYSWSKQADMRKFKNYINKIARDKKFYI